MSEASTGEVLLATDGSEDAALAARVAGTLRPRLDAKCTSCTSWNRFLATPTLG